MCLCGYIYFQQMNREDFKIWLRRYKQMLYVLLREADINITDPLEDSTSE